MPEATFHKGNKILTNYSGSDIEGYVVLVDDQTDLVHLLTEEGNLLASKQGEMTLLEEKGMRSEEIDYRRTFAVHIDSNDAKINAPINNLIPEFNQSLLEVYNRYTNSNESNPANISAAKLESAVATQKLTAEELDSFLPHISFLKENEELLGNELLNIINSIKENDISHEESNVKQFPGSNDLSNVLDLDNSQSASPQSLDDDSLFENSDQYLDDEPFHAGESQQITGGEEEESKIENIIPSYADQQVYETYNEQMNGLELDNLSEEDKVWLSQYKKDSPEYINAMSMLHQRNTNQDNQRIYSDNAPYTPQSTNLIGGLVNLAQYGVAKGMAAVSAGAGFAYGASVAAVREVNNLVNKYKENTNGTRNVAKSTLESKAHELVSDAVDQLNQSKSIFNDLIHREEIAKYYKGITPKDDSKEAQIEALNNTNSLHSLTTKEENLNQINEAYDFMQESYSNLEEANEINRESLSDREDIATAIKDTAEEMMDHHKKMTALINNGDLDKEKLNGFSALFGKLKELYEQIKQKFIVEPEKEFGHNQDQAKTMH